MEINQLSAATQRQYRHHTARFERAEEALSRLSDFTVDVERRRVVSAAAKLRDQIVEFRHQIERTRPSRSSTTTALAVGDPIAFDLTAKAATLTSTQQINTDAVGYTPRAPLWDGSSTAQPSVSGIYDGSLGTTTLVGTVTRAGVHTVSHARVELNDLNSAWRATLNINRNDPLEHMYSTGIDLDVQFGPGTFDDSDTFSIQLQVDPDVRPNPNGTFDGSMGTDANLESGYAVTNGSFTVNGELIDVDADDTTNNVLAKINASAAGVSVVYDATDESIRFVQDTLGAAHTIDLANDTSGFLAAMKLDTATLVPGTDSDVNRPVDQVAALGPILGGSILINAVPVAIDPATDSTLDIIEAINASNAGVVASLDAQYRLSIKSASSGSFELDGNGTQLFAAFGIESSRYSATTSRTRPSDASLYRVSRAAQRFVRGLNTFFTSPRGQDLSSEMSGLKDRMALLMQEQVATKLTGLKLRPGLRPAAFASKGVVGDLNASELRRGMRWQLNPLKRVFLGSTGNAGALDALIRILDESVLAPTEPGRLVREEV